MVTVVKVSDNRKSTIKIKSRAKTKYQRLKTRILKNFAKKKFIGDIYISDEDYELLLKYFRQKYKFLSKSYTHKIVDPIFATALVQIGIKHYDGGFWNHVKDILELQTFQGYQQEWIGRSFIETLSKYNKLMLPKNEKVNNILMHGVISDHYAMQFFDFLFAYYKHDLERDIEKNEKKSMDLLTEVMLRNDNTGRTYWLVKQTSSAVYVNRRGMKIRIRNILKMMDQCFWDGVTPRNMRNRLNNLFLKWKEQSQEYNLEWDKYNGGHSHSARRKSFFSPYIKSHFHSSKFNLILPSQLIDIKETDRVVWDITIGETAEKVSTETYQAVTGYKTEEKFIYIKSEDVFQDIKIDLKDQDGVRLRKFQLMDDYIRFFDSDGNLINADSLPSGKIYSYTKANLKVESEALIDRERRGGLILSYFEFETGDIINLPDGKVLSIGNKIEEGLRPRGKIKDATTIYQGTEYPIYRIAPSILIKMQSTRETGTLIKVNDMEYRMSDINVLSFELYDRSLETGYIIPLSDLGCSKDGLYEVLIDAPNDRRERRWKFAIVNGFEYEYEGAPYIFNARGSIHFNKKLRIQPNVSENIKKIPGENSFNFELVPGKTKIYFDINAHQSILSIAINIPVLNWRFDEGKWEVLKPSEIWHGDFPTYIYFLYPSDKLRLVLDGDIDDEEEHELSFDRLKELNIFACDVTKFRSWLTRESERKSMYINLGGKSIHFLDIITKSTVESFMIKGDFKNDTLIADIDIIGHSNYYADIFFKDKKIRSMVPFIDGKFEVPIENLLSGKYKVTIFEEDDDDSGFSGNNMYAIGEFRRKLINPYNLHGKEMEVKHIKKGENSIFKMNLDCSYQITNLEKRNRHNYIGDMLVKGSNHRLLNNIKVNVEFYNINRLRHAYITFEEDGEYLEFIYDTSKNIIVKEEEKNLPASVKYRRYEVVYPEEYIFIVDF